MVPILKINLHHPEPRLLEKARDTLAAGGLVIVPTETVYGVACDPAVPGAMEKLVESKGRDRDKPIARLAAGTEQAASAATNWNTGLQALAKAYWPGPLTIVLETGDRWTGYRVPNHPVALALARLCRHTLALTSANLSGEPDTKTAEAACAAVAADLALDSGPASEAATPSTVVKVSGNMLECLREGGLPFSQVEQTFRKGLEE
jgi:L-threonylcarbamoyladenylate synthase